MSLSRRALLGAGAAVALPAASRAARPRGTDQPKNIILCVADGMAMATVTMADVFQQITRGHGGYWAGLLNEEYVTSGLQRTRSLNSLVTDSAAASSSWGSGRHIWNGQINCYPDRTELRPLASLMTEAGMRVGLVTTTTVTHATPSGFSVSCVQRDLEGLIAEKHLKSGVDVLLGGGSKFFAPDQRPDKRDLYADFARQGFKIVRTRDELKAAPAGGKLLGTFTPSYLPYTVDRDNDPALQATVPTLAEMAGAALANLSKSPKGFLLQIEGGRVDMGGHANDLAALVYDQIAFEEAVKVAVDFARRDKNTLVVITTDHATGGPALNGAGPEYSNSTGGLRTLEGMRGSYTVLIKEMGATPTPDKVRETVQARLGLVLTSAEAGAIVSAANGAPPFALSEFNPNLLSTLGTILGNHSKVTWTSLNHTSDHVLVSALGPGSEQFAGITENVRFFDRMLATRGLKWSNPTMDFETARNYYEKLKVTTLADRELWERYASTDEDDCGHGAA